MDYGGLGIDWGVDGVICFGGMWEYGCWREVVKVMLYLLICM